MNKLKILLSSLALVGISEAHGRVDYGPKPKTAVELIQKIEDQISQEMRAAIEKYGLANENLSLNDKFAKLQTFTWPLPRDEIWDATRRIYNMAYDLADLITEGKIPEYYHGSRDSDYVYGFKENATEAEKEVVKMAVPVAALVMEEELDEWIDSAIRDAKEALEQDPKTRNTIPHLNALKEAYPRWLKEKLKS